MITISFFSLVEPLAGYEHNDFYDLTAKYKFTLSLENAHCNDYVTEKVWRPLMLGSVPVISGSAKIRVSYDSSIIKVGRL